MQIDRGRHDVLDEYRTDERPFLLKLMPIEQSLPLLSSLINPKSCLN